METISLEDALLLFKMPRIVGEFEGKEMKVGIGRFGPYVVHNNAFTSLTKEDDPYTVTGDRCVELIKAKREKDAAKIIKTFDENPDLKVINGRWGPCIILGKAFFKIPKDKEPSKLKFGDIVEIIGGIDAYEQAVENSKFKAGAKGKGKAKAKATKEEPKKLKIVKKGSAKKAKTPAVKKAAAKKASPKKVTAKKTVKKSAPKKAAKKK